uniref:IBB domain-containing protein n=1 Tax=Zea mays TaxID=4577 RepID=A0A804N558_MAIZE|eukprot:XP_008674296.1 importin subunit alpha-1b-like [Zea mays]
MSLRPSEREQMRKGNYKQTVDAEESRCRCEGQMMDMRKAKREESFQKKRCDGFPASAAGVPPMGHSTALQQKGMGDVVALDLLGSDLIFLVTGWLAGDGAGRPLQRPLRAA